MKHNQSPLRFIDLFSGLGGFHQALARLGHECVFACEIDEKLATLYEKNFDIRPYGDIRKLDISTIPNHDILCAGFPCQPFSKAGEQKGFNCPKSGNLIDYILDILQQKKPEYLILENVPNFIKHDNGKTWEELFSRLEKCEYDIDKKILSPHHFGVPHRRERLIIVGSRKGLHKFTWPPVNKITDHSIKDILDRFPNDARPLETFKEQVLEIWQEFIELFPSDKELPSFPIWAMEFGADYPFENETPYKIWNKNLTNFKGSFGISLKDLHHENIANLLPSYAVTKQEEFPVWKRYFIRANRQLYKENKSWIDPWLKKLIALPASAQKLEWNCKGEKRNLYDHIIQFRPSGIRVKRATMAPSLVASTITQLPIIPWENRFMTVRECSRLQSMGDLKYLLNSDRASFKALGNAVNVDVIFQVADALLSLRAKEGKAVSKASGDEKKGVTDDQQAA